MTNFVVKLLQRTQLSHSQVDKKPFIYARSNWLDDEVEFQFLSTFDNQNYRGSLKYTEIRSAASDLDVEYELFLSECKNALTTHMGLTGFDYEIAQEDEQQQVFKLHKCDGYEALYLDIPLKKVSNCYQLLDAAIDLGQQPATAAPSTDLERLGKHTIEEYEKYVTSSKEKEAQMLKKFILLINSKKAHIRDLKRQLEERHDKHSKQRKNSGNEDTDDDGDEEEFGAATQAMDMEKNT
ncbi:uncharacterized protein LOC117895218 [Drosophila subobscura]|uniref:uncharacterized protein LOC117895218 n=1 Tax=Drosophila subobscura TaxID=7241 RepID=UPI00155AB147|nr:uncharacterized protein LOC117895218 [Drosophila subobscura]